MTGLILLEVALDDFIVVSGERIKTETDTRLYPFTHAVTFRLSPHAAARLGQDIITVSEASILIDCELPKATQLPAVERDTATKGKPLRCPLTLFGTQTAAQLTLFD